MIERRALQTLSNTASQSTIRLLPSRSDYTLLTRRDLYACLGVFFSFFIAGNATVSDYPRDPALSEIIHDAVCDGVSDLLGDGSVQD